MASRSNPFLSIRPSTDSAAKSIYWYRNQVKKLQNINPTSLIANSTGLTTKIMPGRMYMFFYDPKYKDTLPYWDRFPLVIPFRAVPGGFYGINLHYLPTTMRFKLLGALHVHATDDTMSEKTRLKINWEMLQRLSTVAPIQKCTKHYLNDHVESRFLEIKYPDWLAASLLPVEKFEGATKETVWKHAKRAF